MGVTDFDAAQERNRLAKTLQTAHCMLQTEYGYNISRFGYVCPLAIGHLCVIKNT
jgi:hypothetical protein